jgi:hypothetical protein
VIEIMKNLVDNFINIYKQYDGKYCVNDYVNILEYLKEKDILPKEYVIEPYNQYQISLNIDLFEYYLRNDLL